MSTSTSPRARISCFTDSWSVPGTSCTRRRAARRRPRRRAARRRAPCWSCTPTPSPRSSTALPLLSAQAGGVDGDVGPGLVDDPDDAERHADLAQLEPVGQRASRGRPRRPGRAGRRRGAAPSAIAASRLGVSVSRSTMPSPVPGLARRGRRRSRWPPAIARSPGPPARRRWPAARRPSPRAARSPGVRLPPCAAGRLEEPPRARHVTPSSLTSRPARGRIGRMIHRARGRLGRGVEPVGGPRAVAGRPSAVRDHLASARGRAADGAGRLEGADDSGGRPAWPVSSPA